MKANCRNLYKRELKYMDMDLTRRASLGSILIQKTERDRQRELLA